MHNQNKTVNNAIKLIGETVAPGTSLLIDGKILSGAAHMLVGMWSRAALGPLGLGLVIANSYATSTTGKGLLGLFSKDKPAAAAAPAAPTAAPAAAPAAAPEAAN